MAVEKRLIDANKARVVAQRIYSDPVLVHVILNTLNETPTVDAVEVVHGRWKYYHKQNIAVCTNCSFERDLDANFGKAVSCPNCGAKMDGGELQWLQP